MRDDELPLPTTPTGNLDPLYQRYERQKCFIGYSLEAPWGQDLVETCNEVLAEFDMEPWYESEHFDPTQPLREKVVEMIANTRCGIYDISHWRKDNKGEWHLPSNVFLELGIAIALNRPLLMLRHTNNTVAQLKLPECLESVSTSLVEFKSLTALKPLLQERLMQWQKSDPQRDWWNRYCTFGNRSCGYREMHPHLRQWSQEKLLCHISDGPDDDRDDFRGAIEDVLDNFDNIVFRYLDWFQIPEGYNFQLCGLCQTIRSSPFAIYRISEQTHAETYMAIGMSLALETQFEQKIPKIMRTGSDEPIPSLLDGYDVVPAQDRKTWRRKLRVITPQIIRQVRKSTWKARPLPFIEVKPDADEQLTCFASPDGEMNNDYLAVIGKYGIMKAIDRSEMTVTYLVRDTENDQLYVLKRLHSSLASDSRSVTRFHREADILCKLVHPHILHGIEQGEDGTVPYVVIEHTEDQTLRQLMHETGPLEITRATDYARQIANGLDAAYHLGIVHNDLARENILINSQDQVKITNFGIAHEREVDERTNTQASGSRMASPYCTAPEQLESRHSIDIRSDLYALAVLFFYMLTDKFPFVGDTALDIVVMHMNYPVPSLCRLRPDLPGIFDLFMQKAMAKSPNERYQTPVEFLTALEHLQLAVALTPTGNRTHVPVPSNKQGIPPLIGTTFGQYRIFDVNRDNIFKAFDTVQERIVTLMVFPDFLDGLEELRAIKDSLKKVEAEHLILNESLLQEIRPLAALSHPNLVPVYDFGLYDNHLLYVEEYVEVVPFSEKLTEGIDLQQAVAYVLQAAEGLAYLHAHDLVALTVAPEDILLRSDDRLLLPYWGLLQLLKIIIRTFYLMIEAQPELEAELEAQLAGELEGNLTSTIYSLGITFIACLSSGRPSLGSAWTPDPNQVVRIWDLRAAHVPVELQQIAVKMTRKESEQCYRSMSEVIEALQAALANTEQGVQEDHTANNDTLGMERCAFCDATTTPEDERCSNCGNRLLPEPVPTWQPHDWGQLPDNAGWQGGASAWGQPVNQWGIQQPQVADGWGQTASWPPNNPKATRKLNICPACGEDLHSLLEATVCPHCGHKPNTCPFCLAECRPGDNYCLNCGCRLTPAPTYRATLGSIIPDDPTLLRSFFPLVKYCPACGMVTSNPTFCQLCGRALPTVTACSSCHAVIQAGDSYCMSCGKPVAPTQYLTPGWVAPGSLSPPSSDPWATLPAPDSWTNRAASNTWDSSTYPNLGFSKNSQSSADTWGIPVVPLPGPSSSNTQEAEAPTVEAEDVHKEDADKHEPSPDLTGQFNTAWTAGSVRSTFSLDDLNNIGKTFGDYRILREIGQGGLGRVYLALHTTSHQPAAVKLFYSHLSAKQHQRLFYLESQVLEHLHHSYILPIIEVNLHEEPRYLITAYAPHGSLHERILSGQSLPLESAVTILTQIGKALAHIHQHNIVHRDLKPGNILFNDANEALLADFDIAVVLDTGESKEVDTWGSPPYMAPEQFEGVVSQKSDQYALGCIAYKLVTGRRPFDDSRFIALQFKHSTQAPISPRHLNPTLPVFVEQAILRTMAKNPADRFPDIPAFLGALWSGKADLGRDVSHQWSKAATTAALSSTDRKREQQEPGTPVEHEASAIGNSALPINPSEQSIDPPNEQLDLLMKSLKRAQEAEPSVKIPDYTVVRKIDEGGLSTIYLVEHVRYHEKAALKVRLSKLDADPQTANKFMREIDITSSLKHKNIIRFIANGVAESVLYLLLEYCDGGSTYDLMKKRNGALSLEEATPIMLQAIEGIAYMHAKHVVHRNLKTNGILLMNVPNKRPIAKIASMSLVKNFDLPDLIDQEGSLAGTFVFMPREQVINYKNFKPVSDVWAMGATCYHMLTGKYPRDRKPEQDPLDMVLQNEVIPIRKRSPSIPIPLAEVIDRSLQQDISKRYPDGSEMLEAFLQAVGKIR